MSLVLISPPPGIPLDLEEVKMHLRQASDDDDALITMLMESAVGYLDGGPGILGRCLVSQDWRYTLDRFPNMSGPITIPLPPLIEVLSVKYLNSVGEVTIDPAQYRVINNGRARSQIIPRDDWPDDEIRKPSSVWVDFRAGFCPADQSPLDYTQGLPTPIRHALFMLISHLYEHTDAATMGEVREVPLGVMSLLAPWREGKIA